MVETTQRTSKEWHRSSCSSIFRALRRLLQVLQGLRPSTPREPPRPFSPQLRSFSAPHRLLSAHRSLQLQWCIPSYPIRPLYHLSFEYLNATILPAEDRRIASPSPPVLHLSPHQPPPPPSHDARHAWPFDSNILTPLPERRHHRPTTLISPPHSSSKPLQTLHNLHTLTMPSSPNKKRISAPMLISTTHNSPDTFRLPEHKPVEFSLTAGTDIPAPIETPPPLNTSDEIVRPPTPGGGPLSSHPTTPVPPGAFPESRTPSPANGKSRSQNNSLGVGNGNGNGIGNGSGNRNTDSLTPIASPIPVKRSSAIKRFLSFKSFIGSSSSGASMKSSTSRRPSTATLTGSAAIPPSPTRLGTSHTNGSFTSVGGTNLKRKSSGWFGSASSRRKSGFFVIGRVDEGQMLDTTAQEGRENENQEGEVEKGPPAPTLPELGQLGAFREEGLLSEGSEGAGLGAEDMFKDIK
ncbi:hypothetical protein K402DRAFT_404003 [Aulographum hederae CBS 113979]|uniref:Uncharacterized protein n=1 Tax=Aulographum hederae CBS 113979 TaxID=1176131 RepID=A0A6G1H1L8_9PEZI|nr:hypothetical protein K402DRAFT_404003 [Aulographum hederae CBS 113979]